ncbi:helix-hairpin-helix domain-containing protein [Cellvibrio sp. NN19]|uniref:ComEA family DNA-binding protein n=1 Tax=Cellvibrio chitinivorans TaxID=3102792 RepID=UPI002B40C795|nr:helix-hairpin-helix domain-containing protein [Cellvibrio sp. NN19]
MKFFLSFLSFVILSFGTSSLAFSADVSAAKPSAAKAESVAHQEGININTADVQELTKLKGVGEKKAEAIVAWRKENGNFKTVEQLLEVKGIGEATLAANRENIRI